MASCSLFCQAKVSIADEVDDRSSTRNWPATLCKLGSDLSFAVRKSAQNLKICFEIPAGLTMPKKPASALVTLSFEYGLEVSSAYDKSPV